MDLFPPLTFFSILLMFELNMDGLYKIIDHKQTAQPTMNILGAQLLDFNFRGRGMIDEKIMTSEVVVNKFGENYCAYGRQGRRPTMEDEKLIFEGDDWKIYGVFDGHGGNEVSLLLKERLHIELLSCLRRLKTNSTKTQIAQIIKQCFIRFDHQLFKTMGAKFERVGSTAVLLIHNVGRQLVFVVNLGDSRAIVISNSGKLLFQTNDHKPNLPRESKRIFKAGGFVSQGRTPRVNGRLALSRAFGDFKLKKNEKGQYMGIEAAVSPKPDVYSFSLAEEKHCHVIIACDGLWDVLSVNGVVKMYMNRNIAKNTNSCNLLTDMAYANHSTDNISVLVVNM